VYLDCNTSPEVVAARHSTASAVRRLRKDGLADRLRRADIA
jgi:hypothetical protein